jgi:hypothetical protein
LYTFGVLQVTLNLVLLGVILISPALLHAFVFPADASLDRLTTYVHCSVKEARRVGAGVSPGLAVMTKGSVDGVRKSGGRFGR